VTFTLKYPSASVVKQLLTTNEFALPVPPLVVVHEPAVSQAVVPVVILMLAALLKPVPVMVRLELTVPELADRVTAGAACTGLAGTSSTKPNRLDKSINAIVGIEASFTLLLYCVFINLYFRKGAFL
jgi:hypothetical protein